MLQFFQDRDRQIESSKDAQKRFLDLSRQGNGRGFDRNDWFRNHLPREDKIKNNLKSAAQIMHSRNCKQNWNLCEESLSKELGEMKLNSQRQEKLRQLLWETTPELRELRQKFLLANVTRDQAMQISEHRALLELQRLEERSLTEEAQRQKEMREAEEKKKEIEEFQAKLNYHRELDELRHFKLLRDSAIGNEREKERNAIDEILKKIKEEDQELKQRQIEKQKTLHKDAEELLKYRKEMQQKEKVKDKIQDLKVDEYRKAQELRAKEQSEKRQLCLEQRLRNQEKLLSYLEKLCSENLRQELLRIELAIEEKEAAERRKECETEKNRMKIRQDLQRLYETQMHHKKQGQDLQKKEEELYRQNMMAKLYEQDKLELMSQQKRNLKKLEHRRAVKAKIEEDRKRKAMEKARELADQKYFERLESERTLLINEEKIRFIKDHASELLGYLPKGIFQSNEAVELLGDEFKNFYFRQGCTK